MKPTTDTPPATPPADPTPAPQAPAPPPEHVEIARSDNPVKRSVIILQDVCHRLAKVAGWWDDPATGAPYIVADKVAEKLLLIHSEISEATEGFRKDLMDDHLRKRKMIEVELADAVIRIMDLAGALDLDLGGAIAEKLDYNAKRPDHKAAARNGQGGKKF